MPSLRIWPGNPYPMGATWDGEGNVLTYADDTNADGDPDYGYTNTIVDGLDRSPCSFTMWTRSSCRSTMSLALRIVRYRWFNPR